MVDQLNNDIKLKSIPKRIISLVPSQTELLHDLGLEDCIVGITKFCVHPNHYKTTKQIVGGTKQIHLDKIKALKPDIILCNKEENTKAIVKACQEIATTHVSDIITIDHCLELITQYGIMFNKQHNSKIIIEKVNGNLNDFKVFIKNKPILKVAYFIWKNPWMVAAEGTFINHLLELNNFENCYKNLQRYPEVVINNIQTEGNPELILLSSEPYPFKTKHALELNIIAPKAKVVLVDGEYFSWYGSRLINAFTYFKTLRKRI